MFNNLYEKIKMFMKKNIFAIVLALVLFLLLFIELPYDVEMPGGTIDLENRVTVNGETTEIEGSFNMAYVSVIRGKIPYIIMGLILPDWDVVKQSDSMYENETVKDATKRDKLELKQSINYATVVAMDAAGINYEISNRENYVAYIDPKADTDLKIGDNILAINGEEIKDINKLSEIVQEANERDTFKINVLRDNKKVTTIAKVFKENDKKYIGISAITTFDIDSDVKVEISSKKQESGPSGGLMMTLMTYNALTKQDLTHGKKIVGTGTISLDGSVGEIGGVKYKLMGAVKNKADIFLVPAGNYEEAMEVKKAKKYDIEIVKVSKFQDAIDYLEGL